MQRLGRSRRRPRCPPRSLHRLKRGLQRPAPSPGAHPIEKPEHPAETKQAALQAVLSWKLHEQQSGQQGEEALPGEHQHEQPRDEQTRPGYVAGDPKPPAAPARGRENVTPEVVFWQAPHKPDAKDSAHYQKSERRGGNRSQPGQELLDQPRQGTLHLCALQGFTSAAGAPGPSRGSRARQLPREAP